MLFRTHECKLADIRSALEAERVRNVKEGHKVRYRTPSATHIHNVRGKRIRAYRPQGRIYCG